MQKRKLQIIAAVILFLGLGQTAVAQTAVPVEKEPRHRLKFENQYVRLFDVLILTGDTSLYHIHSHDGVSIRLSDSTILDEVLNGEKVIFMLKKGEVTFAARPIAMTHRVINNGPSDFRNIFIEILPAAFAQPVVNSPPLLGQRLLIDNDRVRAYRVVLEPGQSTQNTHNLNGISVVVSDSTIQTTVSGKKPKASKLRSGEYMWHDAGTTHMIKNIGSTLFEMVNFDLK